MSSNAWEISDDDIANILKAHGLTVTAALLEKARAALDEEGIIDGLLYYEEMDEQTASANSDIESQLLKGGVIPKSPKKFFGPAKTD